MWGAAGGGGGSILRVVGEEGSPGPRSMHCCMLLNRRIYILYVYIWPCACRVLVYKNLLIYYSQVILSYIMLLL